MPRSHLLAAFLLAAVAAPLAAQGFTPPLAPPFAASYTVTHFGASGFWVGGITLAEDQRLWVATETNRRPNPVLSWELVRDASGHITGQEDGRFETLLQFVQGNIGEVPGAGIVYATQGRAPELGLPATVPPPAAFATAVNVSVVPVWAPGAGRAKVFGGGGLWDVAYTRNTEGQVIGAAFTFVSALVETGAMAWVAPGSPGFGTRGGVLVAQPDGTVSAYDVDAAGNPIADTRRVFLTELFGVGATTDPLTGDVLISQTSTIREGIGRIWQIRGFAAPGAVAVVPEPTTLALAAIGLALLGLVRRRRRGRLALALLLAGAPPLAAQTLAPPFAELYGTRAVPLGGVRPELGMSFGPDRRNREPLRFWYGQQLGQRVYGVLSTSLVRDAAGGIIGLDFADSRLEQPVLYLRGPIAWVPYAGVWHNSLFGGDVPVPLPGGAVPPPSFGTGTLPSVVPAGYPGAGRVKLFAGGGLWDLRITTVEQGGQPDVTTDFLPVGALESQGLMAWAAPGSPGFGASGGVLVWTGDALQAFEADAAGNPVTGTRRLFARFASPIHGLGTDPVTGEVLVAAGGAAEGSTPELVRITGFARPGSVAVVPEPGTLALAGLGLALLGLAPRARRRVSAPPTGR